MKIEHTHIVYIVECKDWSYYIGIINDLEKRLWEHNTGQDENSYTYTHRPVELKYFEIFTEPWWAFVLIPNNPSPFDKLRMAQG